MTEPLTFINTSSLNVFLRKEVFTVLSVNDKALTDAVVYRISFIDVDTPSLFDPSVGRIVVMVSPDTETPAGEFVCLLSISPTVDVSVPPTADFARSESVRFFAAADVDCAVKTVLCVALPGNRLNNVVSV